MGTSPIQQNPSSEPEFKLLGSKELFEEPLWKSLFREVDDFFFPKKLPPLQLESKPEPVKEIWGFYDNKSRGFLGSTAAHIVVLSLLIVGAYWKFKQPDVIAKENLTPLVDPGDYVMKPGKDASAGGGGGGDRDLLQATRGKLPKQSLQQITPPAIVIRNPAPKLAVEPTVVMPPEIKIAMSTPPTIGDPTSHGAMPSNGTGALGGLGAGNEGGVGVGDGSGFGKGEGGGTGGGKYHVGHGASAPRVIYQTEPEFSEEARKAKYQGTCTLYVTVDVNGRATDIRVASSLGMGLDEKAIESVKNWKFEPGKNKDGRPVPVEIAVEVDFHLY
jgi:TonB family protein